MTHPTRRRRRLALAAVALLVAAAAVVAWWRSAEPGAPRPIPAVADGRAPRGAARARPRPPASPPPARPDAAARAAVPPDAGPRPAAPEPVMRVAVRFLIALRQHYHASRFDGSGNALPHRFPPSSADFAPARICCPARARKAPAACRAPPDAFDRSPFRELGLALPDPQTVAARLTSRGEGRRARFTLELRVDGDCDGRFETYVVRGAVDAYGAVRTEGPLPAGGLPAPP